MRNQARFRVLICARSYILLLDLGPWDQHPTVTNDAESVVTRVAHMLGGRKLLYLDSAGELGELKTRGGEFAGFAPCTSIPPN